MKVSIVISTYNRARYIGLTIDSFLNLNYPKDKYEIIIVDNNSTDNTKEILNEYLNSELKVKIVYFFEQRQGVHYAKNSGAKLSTGEILYFTDDDMIADQELLNEIIYLFELDNNIAVATGRVLPKWEVKPPEWIIKHCNNGLLSLMDLKEELLISKSIIDVYTCHYAIKKDVFFQAEGLNPEIFGKRYFGDGETGLSIKVAAMGYWFAYNAKSSIYHIIPSTRMTQKYLNNRVGRSGASSHSYTNYRVVYPKKIRCLLRTPQMIIFDIFRILKFILKAIVKGDLYYIRYSIALLLYNFTSLKFDLKVTFNSTFRKIVLKYDWLSNDSEFDHIDFLKL